jgi:hypothetical protein
MDLFGKAKQGLSAKNATKKPRKTARKAKADTEKTDDRPD